jgi:hypothetical protein
VNCLAVHAERAVPGSGGALEYKETFTHFNRGHIQPSRTHDIGGTNVALGSFVKFPHLVVDCARETEVSRLARLGNLIGFDGESSRKRINQISLHNFTNKGKGQIGRSRGSRMQGEGAITRKQLVW